MFHIFCVAGLFLCSAFIGAATSKQQASSPTDAMVYNENFYQTVSQGLSVLFDGWCAQARNEKGEAALNDGVKPLADLLQANNTSGSLLEEAVLKDALTICEQRLRASKSIREDAFLRQATRVLEGKELGHSLAVQTGKDVHMLVGCVGKASVRSESEAQLQPARISNQRPLAIKTDLRK